MFFCKGSVSVEMKGKKHIELNVVWVERTLFSDYYYATAMLEKVKFKVIWFDKLTRRLASE